MHFIDINNPGEGNCAFYAFAIALIDIIKHEQNKFGKSDTLSTWSQLSPSVGEMTKEILHFNYKNQNEQVLMKLQASLRNILFAAHLKQLEDSENLLNKGVYNHFAAIVNTFLTGRPTNPQYNPFEKNADILSIAKNLAARLKRLSAWGKDANQLGKWESYVDTQTLHEFKKNVYSSDGKINENACIVQALKRITENYYWGTHTDLTELAEIFNVTLHTLRNGESFPNSINPSAEPVISINNHHNRHWTTRITVTNQPTDSSTIKYLGYCNDSVLSKEEIRSIFKTYTSGFTAFFTKRNHRAKAEEIISACEDSNKSTSDVLAIINDYINDKTNKFNANSSFIKRAVYILKRSEFFNGHQQTKSEKPSA